jgi:hypothetical protein
MYRRLNPFLDHPNNNFDMWNDDGRGRMESPRPHPLHAEAVYRQNKECRHLRPGDLLSQPSFTPVESSCSSPDGGGGERESVMFLTGP